MDGEDTRSRIDARDRGFLPNNDLTNKIIDKRIIDNMKINVLKSSVVLCAAALLGLLSSCGDKPVPGNLLDASAFETTIDGKPVSLYTITNGTVTAQITNYCGYIVGIYTPDSNGFYDNIVSGYDSIDQYQSMGSKPVGTALGRYANRIANASFTLDGVEYQITRNNGQHTLHGGNEGLGHIVWDVDKVAKDKVVMSSLLADGSDGFPGNFKTILTFSITKDNALSIDYEATTDKPTVCNLSHHVYFNLEGPDSPSVLDHILTLNSDSITEVDATLIPTGTILPVDGTAFDFRSGVRIGDRQMAPMPRGSFAPGAPMPEVPEGMVRSYDQNFCLNHTEDGAVELVASLYSPKTGRFMEVLNNRPGLQVFTGRTTAIALESQNYPDAPNHPDFPSAVLRPGETYHHNIVYRFSVK